MSASRQFVVFVLLCVAFFLAGLAIGVIAADSGVPPPPQVVEVEVPADCDEYQCETPDAEIVLLPVRVPVPFAVADEVIGAYRVNGFLSFRGPGKFSTHRAVMACFPGNF